MSHYHSDIGTIEVDAYINTQRAQVDSIQTINSDEIAALMRVQRHRTAIAIAAKGIWSALAASDFVVVHDIYDSRWSEISFCSTVARIRSFHVNNTPVGYTWTNTARLVHGLSFCLIRH